MSTVLLSTIDSSIVYQTQGSVAPYTEGEGTGIAFTLSLNKRENVVGSLPLNSVRVETITILSPQKYGATAGTEAFDRVVSANLYVNGNDEPIGSLSVEKEQRNINMGVEELPFYAYKFTFPRSVPVSQGVTYTVDLLKDDGTPIVVSINTGVPANGSLSRAVYAVKKSSVGYTSPNAATPLVEITGSDDVLSPTPDEPNKTKTDPLDTNSLVYADNVRVEEAKRFIRNIRWRWDLVSERGAKPKNGFRPKMAMRRFAPGAPLNSIRLILDMITDAAPYVNPIVSGDIIQGRWKPKVTWFRKDMQQQTYDMRGDATVTIVQDLVPDYEDGESDLVNAGGDCSEITEYEYVWDAAEVSAPSMPYPQGVTYGVQGVNRDDDSGLFSYILVKRTAVEQHFGPYISISSAKSYATTEVYKNAYNIPADLPQEGDVVDGGKVTRVSISVNDNCTYNIQIDRSFTSKVKAVKSCARTVYTHQETETTTGQEKGLGEAPAANGGVVKTHISTLEDDGTYTNEIRTNEEQTVQSAVKNITAGKFITVTTIANRGQASSLNIGFKKDECDNVIDNGIGTAKSTLTEGRLYDTEETRYCIIEGTESESSRADKFSKESTSRAIGGDAYPSITVDKDAYYTEETACSVDNTTGAITRTKTVRTELSVPDAVVVHSKSIYGVTTSRLDKNCDCGCKFTNKSYTPDTDLGIGESVKVTMNPGGSADVEMSSTAVNDDGMVIASSGVKTALGKQTSYTEIKNAPFTCNLIPETDECGKPTGAYLVCDTVSPPENGKITNWSSKITEYGTWNTTVEVTEEKITCRSESSTATAFATTETTERISASCEAASKSLGACNEIIAVSSQLTQNGRYDTTKKTTTPKKQVWSTVNNTPFGTTTTTDFRNTASTDNTVMLYKEKLVNGKVVSYELQDGKPEYFSSKCAMNDHALFDGSVTTVSPRKATQLSQMTQDADSLSVVLKGPTGEAWKDSSDKHDPCSSWSYKSGDSIITERRDQDQFGNKDETITVETPSGKDIVGVTFYPTCATVVQMFKFWNYDNVQTAINDTLTGVKDDCGTVIVEPLSIANNLRTGVSVDFNKNKFGLYNGVIHVSGRTSQGGSDSDSEFESTWETQTLTCSISRVINPKGGNGIPIIRTVSFEYVEGTTSTYQQAASCVEGGQSLSMEGFEIRSFAEPITLRGHQNKGGHFFKVTSIKLEKDEELKGMNNQNRLEYKVTTAKQILPKTSSTTTS